MSKAKATLDLIAFDAARYLDDGDAIAEYMTAVLEAGDPDLLLLTLGDVARAKGMDQVATDAGLGRASAAHRLHHLGGGRPALSPRQDPARMCTSAHIRTLPTSTTMTIRLDDKVKDRLDRLATSTHRSKSYLAAEAIRAFVEINEWQVAEVREAVGEADAGDFASDEDVAALARKWKVNARWVVAQSPAQTRRRGELRRSRQPRRRATRRPARPGSGCHTDRSARHGAARPRSGNARTGRAEDPLHRALPGSRPDHREPAGVPHRSAGS